MGASRLRIIWRSRIVWMGDAVRIRMISTMEQIKASAGADDLGAARAAPGRRRAATYPTPSLSCSTCGRFEKIDHRSRIGGIETDGGIEA